MRSTHRSNAGAFTLVELLVVFSLIGIIIGLLVPAIQSAREASFRVLCQNNLRQIALAVQQNIAIKGTFPPLWSYSLFWANGQPTGSLSNWTPYLLPYLEQSALANEYDINEMFYMNTSAIATPLKVLQCPSAPHPLDLVTESPWIPSVVTGNLALAPIDPYFTATFSAAPTDYTGFTKVNDDWKALLSYPPGTPDLVPVLATPPYPTPAQVTSWLSGGVVSLQASLRKPADVTDGLSNAILLIEDAGRPQLWANGQLQNATQPVRYSGWADPGGEFGVLQGDTFSQTLINVTNRYGIYAFHRDGANFPFADGSVRFFASAISARTLVAFLTCSAGDAPEAD